MDWNSFLIANFRVGHAKSQCGWGFKGFCFRPWLAVVKVRASHSVFIIYSFKIPHQNHVHPKNRPYPALYRRSPSSVCMLQVHLPSEHAFITRAAPNLNIFPKFQAEPMQHGGFVSAITNRHYSAASMSSRLFANFASSRAWHIQKDSHVFRCARHTLPPSLANDLRYIVRSCEPPENLPKKLTHDMTAGGP